MKGCSMSLLLLFLQYVIVCAVCHEASRFKK